MCPASWCFRTGHRLPLHLLRAPVTLHLAGLSASTVHYGRAGAPSAIPTWWYSTSECIEGDDAAVFMWNMRRRHSSHHQPRAAARTAVKGAHSLRAAEAGLPLDG